MNKLLNLMTEDVKRWSVKLHRIAREADETSWKILESIGAMLP